MKAIILAGGYGTRLKERVQDIPKPMASVAGRPFLEYILDPIINSGIEEIILSVGYRAEVITAHFKHTYRDTPISYAIESEPLGTGGAIAHALKRQNDQAFIAINGDSFIDIDYSKLLSWYRNVSSPIAMVLKTVDDVSRYGSVIVSNGIVIDFLEKGNSGSGLINAGVYILTPRIFDQFGFAGKFSLESDLLQKHCAELTASAYITDAFFIDIGIPEDYDRAQNELSNIK